MGGYSPVVSITLLAWVSTNDPAAKKRTITFQDNNPNRISCFTFFSHVHSWMEDHSFPHWELDPDRLGDNQETMTWFPESKKDPFSKIAVI